MPEAPPVDTPPVDTPPVQTPSVDSWRDGLPDDLKGSAALESIADVNTLARSFIETKALVGTKTIALPDRNAGEDKWDTFYRNAGRPDSAEAYTLPDQGLPDGFEPTDAQKEAFKARAHKLGLNPLQAAQDWRDSAQRSADAHKAFQEAVETLNVTNMEAIQKEYGTAFDDRVALSRRLIQQFDTEDGQFSAFQKLTLSDGTPVGNHPAMFGLISRIAQQLAEDTILGAGQQAHTGTAPAEARTNIAELEADKEFMESYLNKDAPGHAGSVERMTKLFNAANPEPAKTN